MNGKLTQPYRDADLRALLETAQRGGYEEPGEEHNRDRDLALLHTFIESAARLGEVVRLEVSDLDLDNGIMRIRQTKEGTDRRVAIGSQAVDALRTYLADRAGVVFLDAQGAPMSGETVSQQVRKIAEAAGVTGASAHRFRVREAIEKAEQPMA